MASTGSNLAAERAGKNPAINPITVEINSPFIILEAVKTMVNSVAYETINVPA